MQDFHEVQLCKIDNIAKSIISIVSRKSSWITSERPIFKISKCSVKNTKFLAFSLLFGSYHMYGGLGT